MLPRFLMETIKNREVMAEHGPRTRGPAGNVHSVHNSVSPVSGKVPLIRHPTAFASILGLALLALLTGCTSPGPRNLLRGQKLIEQGKYDEAVAKLEVATSILTTNANAWNYLGLALHYAGRSADAQKAYQRSLALDHDLSEAHYNLGCLWLEQNRPDNAKTEFTAYTLRRGNSLEALLRLGSAQLRAGDVIGAEKS